ncbi:MAG: M23 family metallopeptidase [Treponema sp.]|nr:M23 family metallopeptidase [Treponema sp.]
MKKVIFFIAFIFSLLALGAEEMTLYDQECRIRIQYNKLAYSGDAVFVRLEISPVSLALDKGMEPKATLTLFVDGKSSRKSDFYTIPTSNKDLPVSSITMLTGIPLSSWWTDKSSYSLELSYSLDGKDTSLQKLPFVLVNKTFISETIELDDKNTSIKTDNSKQRMDQIQNLNEILATVNKDAVYQTSAFVKPIDSSYRTSFFADRRIYAYSSGGSSTSLHYGIDFRAAEGTDVFACAKGRVVLAGWRNSTGWSIVIEHLPGLYSLYYHLSEILVKPGDLVDEGKLIAKSGSTGLATGPHLHWEIRLNTEAVSPDFFTHDFAFENEE